MDMLSYFLSILKIFIISFANTDETSLKPNAIAIAINIAFICSWVSEPIIFFLHFMFFNKKETILLSLLDNYLITPNDNYF